MAWTLWLLVAALVPGLTAPADVEVDASAITYEVTLASGPPDEVVEPETFTLQAYEIPGKKGKRRYIFTVTGNGMVAIGGLPIGAVRVDRRRGALPEIVNPASRGAMDALLTLVGAERVQRSRLQGETHGSEQIDLVGIRIDRGIPIEYGARPRKGSDDEVEYRARLTGDPVRTQFGTLMIEVSEYSLRAIYSADLFQFREGRWEQVVRQGDKTERQVLTARVTDRHSLTAPELRAVEREYSLLLPVARVILPGKSAGALELAKEALASYQRDYDEGLLAAAISPLELALKEKERVLAMPDNPDERADLLIGKPAPDFTLSDLEGKEVSLSDYAGKPLVISFWGYT